VFSTCIQPVLSICVVDFAWYIAIISIKRRLWSPAFAEHAKASVIEAERLLFFSTTSISIRPNQLFPFIESILRYLGSKSNAGVRLALFSLACFRTYIRNLRPSFAPSVLLALKIEHRPHPSTTFEFFGLGPIISHSCHARIARKGIQKLDEYIHRSAFGFFALPPIKHTGQSHVYRLALAYPFSCATWPHLVPKSRRTYFPFLQDRVYLLKNQTAVVALVQL